MFAGPAFVIGKSTKCAEARRLASAEKSAQKPAKEAEKAAKKDTVKEEKEAMRARMRSLCSCLNDPKFDLKCDCKDFIYRSQKRDVPMCKHIFGLAALIDDLTPEERGQDFETPTFLNEDGEAVPFTSEDKQRRLWRVKGSIDVYSIERSKAVA